MVAYDKFIYSFKLQNTIINLLIKNKDFVTLMNPSKPPVNQLSTEDMLLGGTWFFNGKKYEEQGHVFDHNFVDETTTVEKVLYLSRQT